MKKHISRRSLIGGVGAFLIAPAQAGFDDLEFSQKTFSGTTFAFPKFSIVAMSTFVECCVDCETPVSLIACMFRRCSVSQAVLDQSIQSIFWNLPDKPTVDVPPGVYWGKWGPNKESHHNVRYGEFQPLKCSPEVS